MNNPLFNETKPNPLQKYIPEDFNKPYRLEDTLTPIVERISSRLADGIIWELFSSHPNETNKTVVFPYQRVDASLISIRDKCTLIDMGRDTEYKITKCNEAALIAIKILLWIEVGFEGFEGYAKSGATRNWTAGRKSDEDSTEGGRENFILSQKDFYIQTVSRFIRMRKSLNISDDCFTQYEVEQLLNNFSRETDNRDGKI